MELMVTLAVVGILASLAVPSYRSFLINQQVASASSDFMLGMMQARSEAMRSGRIVAVFPTDGASWTSGWYLTLVTNSCEPEGDPFGITESVNSQVSINEASSTNSFIHSKPSFTYGASGFPFLCPSSSGFYSLSMNGKLTFEALETGRQRQVVVSLSGRARVCDPAKESSCQ